MLRVSLRRHLVNLLPGGYQLLDSPHMADAGRQQGAITLLFLGVEGEGLHE